MYGVSFFPVFSRRFEFNDDFLFTSPNICRFTPKRQSVWLEKANMADRMARPEWSKTVLSFLLVHQKKFICFTLLIIWCISFNKKRIWYLPFLKQNLLPGILLAHKSLLLATTIIFSEKSGPESSLPREMYQKSHKNIIEAMHHVGLVCLLDPLACSELRLKVPFVHMRRCYCSLGMCCSEFWLIGFIWGFIYKLISPANQIIQLYNMFDYFYSKQCYIIYLYFCYLDNGWLLVDYWFKVIFWAG